MKWLSVKLEKVAGIQGGFAFKSADFTNEGIPLIRIGDIDEQIISIEKAARLPFEFLEKYSHLQLYPGDLLIALTGATTGKTGIVSSEQTPCLLNQRVGRFYLKNTNVVCYEWIKYWIRTVNIQNTIWELAHGGAQPNISPNKIEDIEISLPPISEQRRIIEILDQADALRRMRAEADAKSDRILPALFIKMFGDPSTWADANTETLGSLVNIQSGGTPSKKNPDYWDGDIPWVSPKDMKQDIIFDSIDHISQTAIEETNIKYVEPGAILIVVRGMILAHTIPIALAATRLTINQDMKALYPNCSDIDSTYLHAALKASSRKILSQVGTAGHGTRKFDTDELLKLPILIPSQEQLKKFQIAVTECRVSLAGISKTKKKLETLFNVLLQRAFSGELTAKWREAHIKELLAEMEEQAKVLKSKTDNNYQQLTL